MYWSKGRILVSDKTGPVVVMPDPVHEEVQDGIANPVITSLDEIGSFEDYCKGQFGCKWINTIRLVVTEHRVPLGKHLMRWMTNVTNLTTCPPRYRKKMSGAVLYANTDVVSMGGQGSILRALYRTKLTGVYYSPDLNCLEAFLPEKLKNIWNAPPEGDIIT